MLLFGGVRSWLRNKNDERVQQVFNQNRRPKKTVGYKTSSAVESGSVKFAVGEKSIIIIC